MASNKPLSSYLMDNYALNFTVRMQQDVPEKLIKAAEVYRRAFNIFTAHNALSAWPFGRASLMDFNKKAKYVHSFLNGVKNIFTRSSLRSVAETTAYDIANMIRLEYDAYPQRTTPKETDPNRGAGAISAMFDSPAMVNYLATPKGIQIGIWNMEVASALSNFGTYRPKQSQSYSSLWGGSAEGFWEFQVWGPYPPPTFKPPKGRDFLGIGAVTSRVYGGDAKTELFRSRMMQEINIFIRNQYESTKSRMGS